MYTLSIVTSFLSVLALYAVADRVEFAKPDWMQWLDAHATVARLSAAILFGVSTFLLTVTMGLATGIFASLTLWMLLAGLMVLFAPFERISQFHLGLILLASIGIEVLLLTLQS